MAKARVLIVEDEFIVATDLRTQLEELKYQVCGLAESGDEALLQADSGRPDIILMDISLRGAMDGVAAAGQIIDRFHIPVIFLTSYAGEAVLERAKQARPFGYLLKPYNNAELRATIEVALFKAEMEARLRESEARYRAVVEDQTELICRFDPAGRLTFANPAARRFFPELDEAQEQAGFASLAWPGQEEELWSLVADLAPGRPAVRTQRPYPRAEGRAWLEWSIRALLDPRGGVVEYQAVGREITAQKAAEAEREGLIAELRQALAKVKRLSGLIPICSSCKSIRNDQGYWERLEAYLKEHSEADFSHGICPACARRLYPEFYGE
jgi:PAS domain S-box-containing protein